MGAKSLVCALFCCSVCFCREDKATGKWEEWVIQINIDQPKTKQERDRQSIIRDRLLKIIQFVDHQEVPFLLAKPAVCFPFKLEYGKSQVEDSSWFGASLLKMAKEGLSAKK